MGFYACSCLHRGANPLKLNSTLTWRKRWCPTGENNDALGVLRKSNGVVTKRINLRQLLQ